MRYFVFRCAKVLLFSESAKPIATIFLLKMTIMTNDNCHFPTPTFAKKILFKFTYIYNMYIIYISDIIFTFSSSVPSPKSDTVICHICHFLSDFSQFCYLLSLSLQNRPPPPYPPYFTVLLMPSNTVSNACYGGITMPVYYSKLCLLTM